MFESFITWPPMDQCKDTSYTWEKIQPAARAINGTSHGILRSRNKTKAEYCQGHRHYRVIHTQVIEENGGNIIGILNAGVMDIQMMHRSTDCSVK